MITIRYLICAGTFCSALFSATFAVADAVDDLLAGKPVVIAPAEPSTSSPAASAGTQVLERMLEGQGVDSVSQESIEVSLTGQRELELTSGATLPNTGKLNLVPEPSAVILAVMSLAYFLVFFRRRYSF